MSKISNVNRESLPYELIPRELIQDSTVSDRARFVYCFMMSKPDDWNFFMVPMSKELGYSIDTLRKYINELIQCGWLTKHGQTQNANGGFGAVSYTLHATKKHPNERIACTEKQGTVKYGYLKNHTLHNTEDIHITDNLNNKDINNGDSSFFNENILFPELSPINQNQEEKEKSCGKKEKEETDFENVWNLYGRKGNKKTSRQKWQKLKPTEKQAALEHIPKYIKATPEIIYRKNFETYINQETWEDEILMPPPPKSTEPILYL